MVRYAQIGVDFTVATQPDEPPIVVVSVDEELYEHKLPKLARVLAELRRQYPSKVWQVVPNKFEKEDTGSGLAKHQVIEWLIISMDL